MPGSYTQLIVQIVFCVKYRQNLIRPEWETELFKYITGIVQNKGHKMLEINGVPNHIHMLIGMNPTCCLSDLVREVKKSTNEMINSRGLSSKKFQWQEGYGAFSYRRRDIKNVALYIHNQKTHHQVETFESEYEGMLEEAGIKFERKYLYDA